MPKRNGEAAPGLAARRLRFQAAAQSAPAAVGASARPRSQRKRVLPAAAGGAAIDDAVHVGRAGLEDAVDRPAERGGPHRLFDVLLDVALLLDHLDRLPVDAASVDDEDRDGAGLGALQLADDLEAAEAREHKI